MHLFCISYNETMSEYFDFLSELLEVEFALYFILSMISLITQFDVLIYRKQTFYFYFKNYILYLGLLLLILFFIHNNDPNDNITSNILNQFIIHNFPNRFIWLNALIGINILLFMILFFKRRNINYNIEGYSNKVIDWCVDNYPKSGLKKYPKLIFSNESTEYRGQYEFQTNKITIYIKNIKSKKELTNTLIHEYFHFYLNHGKSNQVYAEKLETIGYENHPEELICNISAKELTELYFKQKNIKY